MAINSCDICGCIPTTVGDAFYNQASLNILCQILAEMQGGVAESVNIASIGGVAVTTQLMGIQVEDTAHVSGDSGVFILGVTNENGTSFGGATVGDYAPIGVDRNGNVNVILPKAIPGASPGLWAVRAEDSASANTDAGVAILSVRRDTPVADAEVSTDGDYAKVIVNNFGYFYVDPVLRQTPVETTPTVTNATSFTLVAANTARRYLLIQNNSAANVMVSLSGQVLTGIVPTSTNKGIVLPPLATYESPSNYCTVSAITIYQTSGGNINTISVVEG